MSRTQVQLWYYQFKVGREDVTDDARPGRLGISTSYENIEALQKIIFYNRRLLLERLLMMLVYRSAHAKQFLRMF